MRLAEELAKALGAGSKVVVGLVDLDHFKNLNTAIGHQAGDAILAEIAQRLQSVVGSDGEVTHYGGDEFAVILTGIASEEEVKAASSRFIEAIAAATPREAPQLRLGASLGWAISPDHGSDLGEVIENAEIALYRAKAEGRGQARMFKPQMRAALAEHFRQASAFRAALENGYVKPFYQPLMRLSDRRSHGFEALARWILPNGNVVGPSAFQAVLEEPETAFILGEHMLRSVTDDLQRWRMADMPACKVSLNVTAPEIERGDYPDRIANIFASKGIPLSHLTVEITESFLFRKTEQVAKTLDGLRELGVSIALDDFGTGFASLTHLKSFAIDQIKIDRSFIVDLPSDTHSMAIVRGALGLARSLGIETVVEGIEDEAQLKCVRGLGCDYGQGYLFSPAIPADAAEAYFRKNRLYRRAKLHQFDLGGA
jgi:diguanylate cyclase (GGDEF)-like protein